MIYPAAAHRKRAIFNVYVKDDQGEFPLDPNTGHREIRGSAEMIPLSTSGRPAYQGHVQLLDGSQLYFRLQPSRKTDSPEHEKLPDFNGFITDSHHNVYRTPRPGAPGEWDWHNFNGETFCDPAYFRIAHRKSDNQMYLKGSFVYKGRSHYLQLWFDFKNKTDQASKDASQHPSPPQLHFA